jgi:hypothetical protein
MTGKVIDFKLARSWLRELTSWDDLITTSEEFKTVSKALALWDEAVGPEYGCSLVARPHRKVCIIHRLMVEHDGMTLERAAAIANEMVM